MNKLLFVAFLFMGLNSYSQKIRNIEVARINNIYISAVIQLDHNNQEIDTIFFMDGEDNRCNEVIEIISLHAGSLDEIYIFLNYLILFSEDFKPGTGGTYKRNIVKVEKNFGMRTISIYDIDCMCSYTDTNTAGLKKLLGRLDKWMNNNNLALAN